MEKSRLYTRTGDKGTTSLVGGQRIQKDSSRIEAYGTIDEFSAHLGLLPTFPVTPKEVTTLLLKIQNTLFNVGCYLATAPTPSDPEPQPFGLTAADQEEIERAIDTLDSRVPKINQFVLPGGSPESAHAHICRTICRRAERRILTLAHQEYVSPLVIAYINRLSDLLFILARYYNHLTQTLELTWQK